MKHDFQLWRNLLATLLATTLLALVAACGGSDDDPAPAPPPGNTNLPLSVAVVGTGTVASQPDGINCSTANCTAEFARNTAVTLTATPGVGQSFTGWTGVCTGSARTCVVTMDPARTPGTPGTPDVTARFAPEAGQTTYTFSLTIAGAGTVTSSPAGINCTVNCTAVFPANTLVTLTATPSAGQSFTAWSGACTGSASSCTVTLDQARTVGAKFDAVVGTSFALNVTVAGSGSVTSNPAGINCGSTCSANFASGTAVTLTATPAAGQRFTSWGGACSGTEPTCALQLTAVRAAQAVFAAVPVGTAFQAPALIETSNDFNVGENTLLAVNRNGDAISLWEQSDGAPNGTTLKVFSRRYQAATGWQAPVAVPGATIFFGNDLVGGRLLLDDAGVATWVRTDLQTRRNTASTGWGAAFSPPNLRFSQSLSSAVMDANGNIAVLRSGSDIEYNTLPAGGQWGSAWTRIDNAGSAVSEYARLALSANGSALAVWRESNPGDSNYSMKAARYTAASGWSAPESIETLFTNVTDALPALAIDAQGNGIAMWQQGNNNTVHYNIYRAASGWQGAVEVTGQNNQLGSAGIDLVMTPDGRAVAAWDGGGCFACLNTMQYNPATGWAAPVEVETYNINRRLRIDDSGRAVMVYSPRIVTSLNFDLVTRSLTFGGQWSAATFIETAAGGVVDNPQFAMTPSGQGVVTWTQNDVATTGARKSLWSAVLR